MLRKLRSRLTYANVTATLALFFALGGSAVAAFVVSSNSQIGPDTIYGANKPASANDNIVAGSVAGSDLASNSVGGGKVVDDSLSALDLGSSSVGSAELGTGAVTTRTLKDGSVTNAKLAPGKVPDADNLDGKDSSLFLQGQGKIENRAVAIPRGGFAYLEDPPTVGWLRLTYFCPMDPAASGQISMRNNSGDGANLFVDAGAADPIVTTLTAGEEKGYLTNKDGDFWTVHFQSSSQQMAIYWIASLHRTDDCHVQYYGLETPQYQP